MLQLFFEGVQSKVAQGVKESEISYQMAYSKPELRKVIREYPAREVKKGLDSLYRKVEKHLCEEENLLQVCFFLCVYICACACMFAGWCGCVWTHIHESSISNPHSPHSPLHSKFVGFILITYCIVVR